jgi:hypothetical protein
MWNNIQNSFLYAYVYFRNTLKQEDFQIIKKILNLLENKLYLHEESVLMENYHELKSINKFDEPIYKLFFFIKKMKHEEYLKDICKIILQKENNII